VHFIDPAADRSDDLVDDAAQLSVIRAAGVGVAPTWPNYLAQDIASF
jgi:hypothetical protein